MTFEKGNLGWTLLNLHLLFFRIYENSSFLQSIHFSLELGSKWLLLWGIRISGTLGDFCRYSEPFSLWQLLCCSFFLILIWFLCPLCSLLRVFMPSFWLVLLFFFFFSFHLQRSFHSSTAFSLSHSLFIFHYIPSFSLYLYASGILQTNVQSGRWHGVAHFLIDSPSSASLFLCGDKRSSEWPRLGPLCLSTFDEAHSLGEISHFKAPFVSFLPFSASFNLSFLPMYLQVSIFPSFLCCSTGHAAVLVLSKSYVLRFYDLLTRRSYSFEGHC